MKTIRESFVFFLSLGRKILKFWSWSHHELWMFFRGCLSLFPHSPTSQIHTLQFCLKPIYHSCHWIHLLVYLEHYADFNDIFKRAFEKPMPAPNFPCISWIYFQMQSFLWQNLIKNIIIFTKVRKKHRYKLDCLLTILCSFLW